MGEVAGWVYAALALGPMAMHVALTLGAPLGAWTVGGAHPGRLPRRLRPLALAQLGLLALMVVAIADRGGALEVGWPGWAHWAALALTAATAAANVMTPSRPERLLWGPVTVGMLVAAVVAFVGDST